MGTYRVPKEGSVRISLKIHLAYLGPPMSTSCGSHGYDSGHTGSPHRLLSIMGLDVNPAQQAIICIYSNNDPHAPNIPRGSKYPTFKDSGPKYH